MTRALAIIRTIPETEWLTFVACLVMVGCTPFLPLLGE